MRIAVAVEQRVGDADPAVRGSGRPAPRAAAGTGRPRARPTRSSSDCTCVVARDSPASRPPRAARRATSSGCAMPTQTSSNPRRRQAARADVVREQHLERDVRAPCSRATSAHARRSAFVDALAPRARADVDEMDVRRRRARRLEAARHRPARRRPRRGRPRRSRMFVAGVGPLSLPRLRSEAVRLGHLASNSSQSSRSVAWSASVARRIVHGIQ